MGRHFAIIIRMLTNIIHQNKYYYTLLGISVLCFEGIACSPLPLFARIPLQVLFFACLAFLVCMKTGYYKKNGQKRRHPNFQYPGLFLGVFLLVHIFDFLLASHWKSDYYIFTTLTRIFTDLSLTQLILRTLFFSVKHRLPQVLPINKDLDLWIFRVCFVLLYSIPFMGPLNLLVFGTDFDLNVLLLLLESIFLYLFSRSIIYLRYFTSILFQIGVAVVLYLVPPADNIGDQYCFLILSGVLAMTGLSFRKISRLALVVHSILLGLAILGSQFGFTMYDTLVANDVLKHDFGFGHPNLVAILLVELMVLVILTFYRRPTNTFIVLMILTFILFMLLRYVRSSTGIVGGALIYLGYCIYSLFSFLRARFLRTLPIWPMVAKINHIMHGIAALPIYSVMALFIFESANRYSESQPFWFLTVMQKFTNTYNFESRLKLAHEAYSQYPLRLLGNQIDYAKDGTSYFVLDNFYVHTVFYSGILLMTAFVIIVTYAIYRNLRAHNYLICYLFAVYAVYGFSENVTANMIYNILPLMAFAIITFRTPLKKINAPDEHEDEYESTETVTG